MIDRCREQIGSASREIDARPRAPSGGHWIAAPPQYCGLAVVACCIPHERAVCSAHLWAAHDHTPAATHKHRIRRRAE
jgi:hypothetical protein